MPPLGDGEGHGWQETGLLLQEKLVYRLFSALEPVVAISQTFGQELLVQGLEAVGLR